jgi:hypothetical protein
MRFGRKMMMWALLLPRGDPESRKWSNKRKTVDKNIAFSGYLEKSAALGSYLQRIQYNMRSFWSQKVLLSSSHQQSSQMKYGSRVK